MEGVPSWYGLCQAALCLSAGWAILSLYFRGVPVRQGSAAGEVHREAGILWLGVAVVIWGLVGLILLLPFQQVTLALRPFLSAANSASLLISASYLDYGPEALQRAREHPWWNATAIGGALAVAVGTLAL